MVFGGGVLVLADGWLEDGKLASRWLVGCCMLCWTDAWPDDDVATVDSRHWMWTVPDGWFCRIVLLFGLLLYMVISLFIRVCGNPFLEVFDTNMH